jgi:hypothetical protein
VAARVFVRFHTGPFQIQDLSITLEDALLNHYNDGRSEPAVHHRLDRTATSSAVLRRRAEFFDYLLLDGRRITPSALTRRVHEGSSLVKAAVKGSELVGVVVSLFRHRQPGIQEDIIWAEMRWMKELQLCPTDKDYWMPLCVCVTRSHADH